MSRHRGTVLSTDALGGLIDCPELASSVHGVEIAVTTSELGGLRVGDNVEFTLNANASGAYASQVRAAAPVLLSLSLPRLPDSPEVQAEQDFLGAEENGAAQDEDAYADDDERWCEGVIKAFDVKKGFGFIACPELRTEFGCDVFLHHKDIDNFSVGDYVRFTVVINPRGQPQATALRQVLAQGRIKFFDPDKGYGFISSPEVASVYQRDVFLHQNEMEGFSIGDEVEFVVKLNKKGQPQAMSMSLRTAPAQGSTAERSAGDTARYRGTVKMVNNDKGMAFINCPELQGTYERDPVVSTKQLQGFGVGDLVSFSVKLNSRGMPQASDLAAAAEAEDEDDGEDDDDFLRSSGAIKSFNAEKGFGFISSVEAQERYGRDVFLHARQVKGFQPGDAVTFSVRINNQGHPQAYGLKAAPKTLSWLGGDEEADGVDPAREYEGFIKSFNEIRGFGFIECIALQELFSRDVFIPQSQFEGHRVGERVRFRVQVKKGQPQAMGVALAPTGEPVAAPKDPAAAAALDRKMLRACASAKAESCVLLEELLALGADANARDVTGQTPLMVSALNVRHSERKCRALLESKADLAASAVVGGDVTVLQWARDRINAKFASYLEAVGRGDVVDYRQVLDAPYDDF